MGGGRREVVKEGVGSGGGGTWGHLDVGVGGKLGREAPEMVASPKDLVICQ